MEYPPYGAGAPITSKSPGLVNPHQPFTQIRYDKLLMRLSLLPLFLTAFAAAGLAQNAPAPKLACEGNMATIRLSAVTPTGTMEGLLKAVAAQKDWYHSHGQASHEIYPVRIIVRDEKTRAQTYSDKEVLTYHVRPASDQPEAAHDAGYDAFVKLYRENSDIKQTWNVCLPKSK